MKIIFQDEKSLGRWVIFLTVLALPVLMLIVSILIYTNHKILTGFYIMLPLSLPWPILIWYFFKRYATSLEYDEGKKKFFLTPMFGKGFYFPSKEILDIEFNKGMKLSQNLKNFTPASRRSQMQDIPYYKVYFKNVDYLFDSQSIQTEDWEFFESKVKSALETLN